MGRAKVVDNVVDGSMGVRGAVQGWGGVCEGEGFPDGSEKDRD